MEEGVECSFEVVDDSKGIVAITRAKEGSTEWAEILNKIANIAMQAKIEFCDKILLQQFLLKSADPSSFRDNDKLFSMNDIQRVLEEGKANVVSCGGRGFLDSSYPSVLRGGTYFGMLAIISSFPKF